MAPENGSSVALTTSVVTCNSKRAAHGHGFVGVKIAVSSATLVVANEIAPGTAAPP